MSESMSEDTGENMSKNVSESMSESIEKERMLGYGLEFVKSQYRSVKNLRYSGEEYR